MMQAQRSMGLAQWIMLGALSLVWGGSFYFYKVLVAELHPFSIVFGRMLISALFLALFAYMSGNRLPRSLTIWKQFFILGILQNVIPFSLIAQGETQIASGLASILNATTPMFTAIAAHFLTKDEKLTPNRIVGVVLGILGVIVLIGPTVLRGLSWQNSGELAVLAAAFTYGFAGIYGRRLREVPPTLTAAGTSIASSLVSIPLVLFVDRPWTAPLPGNATWLALLGIGVLSTAVAYLLYYRILATSGATNASLVTLLVPISAIFLGTLFLGEHLQWNNYAGMGLIFAGLATINANSWNMFRRPVQASTPSPACTQSVPEVG